MEETLLFFEGLGSPGLSLIGTFALVNVSQLYTKNKTRLRKPRCVRVCIHLFICVTACASKAAVSLFKINLYL